MILITLIPVFFVIAVFLDFAFGGSDTLPCIARDKDWHLSCNGDGVCHRVYTFEAQCTETKETGITSSSEFWYAHDTGDDLKVQIKTSRILGMRSASVVEE